MRRYIKVVREEAPSLPDGHIMHLEVCGKKAGFTSSVRFAHDVFTKQLGAYGARAAAARSAQGVDWQAQYHALRVAYQTIELLTTGTITFPRPEAELLLKVRRGEMESTVLSELIEAKIEQIYEARKVSSLREAADARLIKTLVRESNLQTVLDTYNQTRMNSVADDK